ncbi:MAG: CRTAC1 family protein [Verrucomicrobiales bacterium]|nr:CRTAC1 family protein [Verrucomicrobiales bacterium]
MCTPDPKCGPLRRCWPGWYAWLLLALGGAMPGKGAVAPTSGIVSGLPYDPICTIGSAGKLVALRPVPPGTQRMIERLERCRDSADPSSMAYLNDRLIPVIRDRITAIESPVKQLPHRFQLGKQLVLAGYPAPGLKEFDTIEEVLRNAGSPLAGRSLSEMRIQRAVALMRLGEQENCLTNHHAKSCIVPIAPEAVHQFPRGSREAIEVLAAQLTVAPSDLRARWLLNLAYMTLGEWPSRVPSAWLIPPSVFASEYDLGFFPDVAGSVGVDVDDLAGGCILDDFNNDDRIDIVASSWSLRGQLRYFSHEKDGRFVERTAEAGLAGLVSGLNIQQTDFNNDGWLDIWVLRGAWLGPAGRIPNSLLRNNRDGTFTDVTEESGLLTSHPTQASTWFDFNGDGWLDLFVGNETIDPRDPDPCELFRNNGDGTFTECAAESGLRVVAFIKGVTSGDYDNDGRPDLYLSNRGGPNLLFHNDGPAGTNSAGQVVWRFRDATAGAGISETIYSFPTWFFDYDNDGFEDLFVSGYLLQDVGDIAADYLGLRTKAARPRLYRNLGNGTFTNLTAQLRIDRVCHTMGSNFGDLDNDGWLDFYLGTGDPDFTTLIPNRMFRNAEGRAFQEITTSGGFGHIQKGHGIGFADLDHDGDQDVYATIGGAFVGDHYPNALFMNPGHGNHWLKVKCVGTRSNRAAIGTRLRLTVQTPTGERRIFKTVNSGGSFGSSPFRQEIGLGHATSISKLEVFWPASGRTQTFTNLRPDRYYQIQEGHEQAVEIALAPLPFDLTSGVSHAHRSSVGP